jgi:hypothetical protein
VNILAWKRWTSIRRDNSRMWFLFNPISSDFRFCVKFRRIKQINVPFFDPNIMGIESLRGLVWVSHNITTLPDNYSRNRKFAFRERMVGVLPSSGGAIRFVYSKGGGLDKIYRNETSYMAKIFSRGVSGWM